MLRHNKILVADDEPNVRRVLVVSLSCAGYDVLEAADGEAALAQIRAGSPDLVVLDLRMPGLDGIGVLRELNGAPAGAHRPKVIVLTAHGSIRQAIEAVRLGASDFLQKPATPEELRLGVASALREPKLEMPYRPATPAPCHVSVPGAGGSTSSHTRRDVGAVEGADYATALDESRRALAAGRWHDAERILLHAAGSPEAGADPAYLNLVGVLHEAEGRLVVARTFYKKAIAADRTKVYAPPRDNYWRVYDMLAACPSDIDVSLGSESELDRAFPGGIHRGDTAALECLKAAV